MYVMKPDKLTLFRSLIAFLCSCQSLQWDLLHAGTAYFHWVLIVHGQALDFLFSRQAELKSKHQQPSPSLSDVNGISSIAWSQTSKSLPASQILSNSWALMVLIWGHTNYACTFVGNETWLWRVQKEWRLTILITRVLFHTWTSVWGVGVFLSHERSNKSGEAQKCRQSGKGREKGLWGCMVNNSYPSHCTWFIWEARRKKKKPITFTDGYPIQGKCQKDSHDSQSTCEKEHGMENMMDLQMVICAGRWWKAHHKCFCIILFSGILNQNNLCVLKRQQMMHSHLVRMFIFAVIKYRRIQKKRFFVSLWD